MMARTSVEGTDGRANATAPLIPSRGPRPEGPHPRGPPWPHRRRSPLHLPVGQRPRRRRVRPGLQENHWRRACSHLLLTSPTVDQEALRIAAAGRPSGSRGWLNASRAGPNAGPPTNFPVGTAEGSDTPRSAPRVARCASLEHDRVRNRAHRWVQRRSWRRQRTTSAGHPRDMGRDPRGLRVAWIGPGAVGGCCVAAGGSRRDAHIGIRGSSALDRPAIGECDTSGFAECNPSSSEHPALHGPNALVVPPSSDRVLGFRRARAAVGN